MTNYSVVSHQYNTQRRCDKKMQSTICIWDAEFYGTLSAEARYLQRGKADKNLIQELP